MLKEARQYSIQVIQDEVRSLVERGSIGKKNQLYTLAKFFGDHEWPKIERILETNEFLLRDPVYDLIGQESWMND
ncbi:MAG: DUF4327 family protein [Cyanobacteria bacterium P01_F01_bin.53]